jgi:uncharacterized protein (DUF885 family)
MTVKEALDAIAAHHATPATYMDAARKTLEQATAFVREKGLVTLPARGNLQVIETPEFMRGIYAVGGFNAAPALEPQLGAFYWITPIPASWPKDRIDSKLREYNDYGLQELTIHEAMPGHYVQLWHSNKYPSVLRAVLYSGAFVEGWAVYAEKVMADSGYLDNDPLYHLVHLKWDLRAIANAILDQAIHVDGMTEQEAMTLMTAKTFQEEREAAGKWTRARLTSAQLPTYFVGWQEHLDLRAEVEKHDGDKFDLKAYHDKLLSFGSPPVRYVRELMLDQPVD